MQLLPLFIKHNLLHGHLESGIAMARAARTAPRLYEYCRNAQLICL